MAMNLFGDVCVEGFRSYARERVLAEIATLGFATRSELMRRLGMSRTMLTRVLETLFDDSLLEEYDDARPLSRGAGRPAKLLRLRAPATRTLAIRLRSDETDIAIVSERADFRARAVAPLGLSTPARLTLEVAIEHARLLIAESDVPPDGCVLVLPTMITADQRGILAEHAMAQMPSWVDDRVIAILGERLGMPVTLGNDGQLGALAEAVAGGGRGARTMIYVALGANGIGGGVVVDGRLLRGTGAAGEISHLSVHPGGAPCPCGRYGCFAAEIDALAARYRGSAPRRSDSAGLDDDPELLNDFYTEALPVISRAIATAVNLLSPDVVVVHDALSQRDVALRARLRTAMASHVHPALRDSFRVVGGRFGRDAPLAAAGIMNARAHARA